MRYAVESNSAIGNGAGHHSVLQLPHDETSEEEWLICYHRRPIEESGAHFRVTCLDQLIFAENGDIVPVVITHEGVVARPLLPGG